MRRSNVNSRRWPTNSASLSRKPLRIVVVANGELPSGYEHRVAPLLAAADAIVAADGGLGHCAALGVWPTVLVGDLDSAPQELIDEARERSVRSIEYPADKDATDLELALAEATRMGATSITVVAAFGGRLDHEIATLALLTGASWRDISMSAADGRRSLWIVRSSVELALSEGQSVSLIPWGKAVEGVTTQGLQWPLQLETLAVGSSRGVSNLAETATQTVSIESGVLLVITDRVEFDGP